MNINRIIKRRTSYLLIIAVIAQFAMGSLLCATSGYAAGANAITICSPMGLKTIHLDQNGEPVEQHDPSTLSHICFHCATGCAGGLALLPTSTTIHAPIFARYQEKAEHQTMALSLAFLSSHLSRAPPLTDKS